MNIETFRPPQQEQQQPVDLQLVAEQIDGLLTDRGMKYDKVQGKLKEIFHGPDTTDDVKIAAQDMNTALHAMQVQEMGNASREEIKRAFEAVSVASDRLRSVISQSTGRNEDHRFKRAA